MSIYYLIVGVVVFFIIAGLYARRALRSSNDDHVAVPISDLNEINEFKKAYDPKKNPESTKPSEGLATHLINENLMKKDSSSVVDENSSGETQELSTKITSLQKDLDFLKQRSLQKTAEIDKLKDENERLNTALQREVSSKDTVTLSEDEKRGVENKGAQLHKANTSNEHLTKENLDLQKKIENVKKANSELQKEMEALKIFEEIKPREEELSKIDALEKELSLLKTENQKLLSEKNTIGSREMENISLKKINNEQVEILNSLTSRYEELEKGFIAKKDEMIKVQEESKQKTEKLLKESQEAQKVIIDLKVELESVKSFNEQQLIKANEAIQSLKIQLQNEQTLAIKQLGSNNQMQNSQGEMQELEKAKESLIKENTDLELTIAKVQEYNKQLVEKEQILQYELTKSRAQTLGLERVCKDFKIQIDHLSKVEK